MTKHRVKLALAGILLLASLGLLVIGIGRLGRLIEFFGSGADPADALAATSLENLTDGDLLVWAPDPPQPARQLEPASRLAVTDGYLRAWDAIAAGASEDGTYLTGPARLAGDRGPSSTLLRHYQHALQLEFYSADGQILVLTDIAGVVRTTEVDGDRLLVGRGPEQFRAILLLEDGNWRVRSLTRLDANSPELGFLAGPRPNLRIGLAGGALVLALVTLLPGRLFRRTGGPSRTVKPKPERN